MPRFNGCNAKLFAEMVVFESCHDRAMSFLKKYCKLVMHIQVNIPMDNTNTE